MNNTKLTAHFDVEVVKVSRLTGEVTLKIGDFVVEGFKQGFGRSVDLGHNSIYVSAQRPS